MAIDATKTEVGSYFVSNYPPFSHWTREAVEEIEGAMSAPPREVPLGLYLHIPFCRKRCKFCYYKVFTDNRASDIELYVRARRPTGHELLIREMLLQLKRGWLDAGYFRRKFGAEILDEWSDLWQADADDGLLAVEGDRIELTRQGLLRVDAVLPAFFEPQHQGVRYT